MKKKNYFTFITNTITAKWCIYSVTELNSVKQNQTPAF